MDTDFLSGSNTVVSTVLSGEAASLYSELKDKLNKSDLTMKLPLSKELLNKDGSVKLIVVEATLAALHQKLNGEVVPAAAVILDLAVPDTKSELGYKFIAPVQLSMFAGGLNVDRINVQTGNLTRLMAHSYNKRLDRPMITGSNNNTNRNGNQDDGPKPEIREICNFFIGVAGEVLDTVQGIQFRAWLLSDEARQEVIDARGNTDGLSKGLAVKSDHYKCVRETGTPQAFLELTLARKQARENGESMAGISNNSDFGFK